jgi:class 3 adenylate cyclase
MAATPHLPSGTVTFVFSDLEGSTALLKVLGDAGYREALATHRRLVRETFAEYDGHEIDTQGDAFFYSFTRARAAVAAAVAIQRAHALQAWPGDATVRIRLGLHTGEPAVGEEGYTGLDVVRAARIAAVGRGGQVLLSDTTRAIAADDLPDGVELRWVGEQRLKDIERPEPLHELRIDDLPMSASPALGNAGEEATRRPMRPGGRPAPGPPPRPPGLGRSRGGPRSPGGPAREIEERVLATLERALRERPSGGERGRRNRSGPPTLRRRSVADEIDKLRALRDSGALTDEQYARAVERTIGGDGGASL